MAEKIEVGDHVFIGPKGQIHWVVTYMPDDAQKRATARIVTVQSPMYGKRQRVSYMQLRLHSKGKKE